MKIAVINETSAADRNGDIIKALEGRGHDIINCGMMKSGEKPEMSYIHTGFLSALLLNTGRADFVVGGCGTGQGYLNAAMQFPGVFCGHILTALDAWLFTQINGGNCISLALNQGYGWAADINLQFIFDRIFSVEQGAGYPEHRKEPQKASRELLEDLSCKTHKSFGKIIDEIPASIFTPVITYPGVRDILSIETLKDNEIKESILSRMETEGIK